MGNIFTRKSKIIQLQQPPQYYFFGTLYNKEINSTLQLFARERYRYMWDYYIIFYSKNGMKNLLDIASTNKEYEDREEIYIEIFDKKFKLYKKNIVYQYNPNYLEISL